MITERRGSSARYTSSQPSSRPYLGARGEAIPRQERAAKEQPEGEGEGFGALGRLSGPRGHGSARDGWARGAGANVRMRLRARCRLALGAEVHHVCAADELEPPASPRASGLDP